jgi:hypothetical protein
MWALGSKFDCDAVVRCFPIVVSLTGRFGFAFFSRCGVRVCAKRRFDCRAARAAALARGEIALALSRGATPVSRDPHIIDAPE